MSQSETTNVAIVTGASRGLGRALTAALLERGWTVVVDARRTAELAATAVAFNSPRLIAIAGDVTDASHRAALVDAAINAGPLSLLVNNASRLGPSPQPKLADYPPVELRAVYDVNVFAPLALIQLALPALLQTHGVIVNLTSDAAIEAYQGWGGSARQRPPSISSPRFLLLRTTLSGSTPSIQATCAPKCIRPRSPARNLRPPRPESVVSAFLRLLDTRPAAGRYRGSDLAAAGAHP